MKNIRQLPQQLIEPLKVSKYVKQLVHNLNRYYFYINTYQKGQKINCSCIPGYYDHCIHSFYVLQKIFKIKQNDTILWQEKYSLKDLQKIIESQKNFSIDREKKKKYTQTLSNIKQNNKEFQELLNNQLENFSILQKQEKQEKKEKKEQKFVQNFNSSAIKSIVQQKQKKVVDLPTNQSKIQQKPSKKSKQLYTQLLTQVKQQLQSQQQQLFGSQQLKSCPICHQDITYQTPIYQCKQICKNYYHIKCLKFWVKHQRKNIIENDRIEEQQFQHRSSIRVTCPMCRNKFPEKIDTLLIEGQKTFKKYYQSHGVNCNQCHEDIYLNLYHCLLCENWNLCDNCYKGWKHQNHDRFLMKNNKKAEWSVPTGRSAFNMTKLEFSMEYIKKISKSQGQAKMQNNMKQLFGQNYSKFIESNFPKPDLMQYLKQSLINIQKQIHKTYKKVDYNEQTLKCVACKKHSIIGMKRMYCKQKHFIDQKCLNFFVKNNLFICPVDKTSILQGLSSIKLTIKSQTKKPGPKLIKK